MRVTVYLHYRRNGPGTIAIWQDGTLIELSQNYAVRGDSLMRAHWGLYGSGSNGKGEAELIPAASASGVSN